MDPVPQHLEATWVWAKNSTTRPQVLVPHVAALFFFFFLPEAGGIAKDEARTAAARGQRRRGLVFFGSNWLHGTLKKNLKKGRRPMILGQGGYVELESLGSQLRRFDQIGRIDPATF